MKKTTFVLLAALLFVVGTSSAQHATQNVNAIHDPMSRGYDSRCLSCHDAVLKTATSDPRILPFHQAMLPYVPGYNARKGPQNANCVMCHRDAIDFRQESGAALRRTVSVDSCVYCHGRSGPGPQFYE